MRDAGMSGFRKKGLKRMSGGSQRLAPHVINRSEMLHKHEGSAIKTLRRLDKKAAFGYLRTLAAMFYGC